MILAKQFICTIFIVFFVGCGDSNINKVKSGVIGDLSKSITLGDAIESWAKNTQKCTKIEWESHTSERNEQFVDFSCKMDQTAIKLNYSKNINYFLQNSLNQNLPLNNKFDASSFVIKKLQEIENNVNSLLVAQKQVEENIDEYNQKFHDLEKDIDKNLKEADENFSPKLIALNAKLINTKNNQEKQILLDEINLITQNRTNIYEIQNTRYNKARNEKNIFIAKKTKIEYDLLEVNKLYDQIQKINEYINYCNSIQNVDLRISFVISVDHKSFEPVNAIHFTKFLNGKTNTESEDPLFTLHHIYNDSIIVIVDI